MVLSRLHQEGLKVKLEKCRFFRQEVGYLGHVISRQGMSADPKKIEAVANWLRPSHVSELHSFLSFVSYYQCFVESFAKLPALHRLVVELTSSKPKKMLTQVLGDTWIPQFEDSSEALKAKLVTTFVLTYTDFFVWPGAQASHGLPLGSRPASSPSCGTGLGGQASGYWQLLSNGKNDTASRFVRDHSQRGHQKNRDLWNPVVHQVVRAPTREGAVYTIAPVNNLHQILNVHQDMFKGVVLPEAVASPPRVSSLPMWQHQAVSLQIIATCGSWSPKPPSHHRCCSRNLALCRYVLPS